MLVKCLNPQQITNKYTGETQVVACGKCEACLNQKRGMASLKCKLESSAHKYSYFVTLTYKDEFIPRAFVVPYSGRDNSKTYTLVSSCERLDEQGLVLADVSSSLDDLSCIATKTNLNGDFPYLSKRDLQLFIKRLRKKLSKYEAIRYYAVGEYGPVHFRPHYHLLLWFNSDVTRTHIQEAVSSCWKFGRVDTQMSRDKASSYVAGYLNGSCNRPQIYKIGSAQPFALHSQFLGEKIFRTAKKEVYEMSVRDFNKRGVILCDPITDVNLWR